MMDQMANAMANAVKCFFVLGKERRIHDSNEHQIYILERYVPIYDSEYNEPTMDQKTSDGKCHGKCREVFFRFE